MKQIRRHHQPFWTERRFYLPLLVAVVGNALVYPALTYRLATKQERLARQHSELTEGLQAKRAEVERLESERERIARNDETAERFWNEVVRPLEPGLTEAWAELDRLVQQSGLQSGRISFSYEPLDVGLTRVNAGMPLEGSYFNLVRFINSLERSPRFFLLQEIGLSRGRGTDTQIGLRCSVAFFVKGDQSEASEPS